MSGRKATKEEVERRALAFINKAKATHGDKYDYSLVEYVNSDTKVKILCKKHGVFEQTPDSHCNHGCMECGKTSTGRKLSLNKETFVDRARETHKNKYDYSKVEYVNSYTKVCIVCPVHGEFWQHPNQHIFGNGCYKCGVESRANKRRHKKEHFVSLAKDIHGDKYDYSKFNYINTDTKGTIICKNHGEFLKTPYHHIHGEQGCPKCSVSSVMEEKFCILLESLGILYEREKTFDELTGRNGRKLRYDFYLPSLNLLVELDGRQHYDDRSKYYTEENLFRDRKKDNFARNRGIEIIRVKQDDFDDFIRGFEEKAS